jgi:hypothetical protein
MELKPFEFQLDSGCKESSGPMGKASVEKIRAIAFPS